MIVIIGDPSSKQQAYINKTVTWLTRNTNEVDSTALNLLPRKHTGRGAIKANPNAREVLYIVGHGTPTVIGGLDVYAVAEKLLQAGLDGERFGSVVLCACSTGERDWVGAVEPEFAKKLARLLQVRVLAPPGIVVAGHRGTGTDGVYNTLEYYVAIPTADQKAAHDALVQQGKHAEADEAWRKFTWYPFFKKLVEFKPDGTGYVPPLVVG